MAETRKTRTLNLTEAEMLAMEELSRTLKSLLRMYLRVALQRLGGSDDVPAERPVPDRLGA